MGGGCRPGEGGGSGTGRPRPPELRLPVWAGAGGEAGHPCLSRVCCTNTPAGPDLGLSLPGRRGRALFLEQPREQTGQSPTGTVARQRTPAPGPRGSCLSVLGQPRPGSFPEGSAGRAVGTGLPARGSRGPSAAALSGPQLPAMGSGDRAPGQELEALQGTWPRGSAATQGPDPSLGSQQGQAGLL